MIRIAMNRPSIGPANVEPLGGSHQCMGCSSFSSLGREAEVRRLRLAARHGHGGGLRAVLLVPRLDRVRPGGQPADGIAPVGAAHAEEGVRQHAHPGVHPARSEEHTSELQSLAYLVCRLLLEKKKKKEAL